LFSAFGLNENMNIFLHCNLSTYILCPSPSTIVITNAKQYTMRVIYIYQAARRLSRRRYLLYLNLFSDFPRENRWTHTLRRREVHSVYILLFIVHTRPAATCKSIASISHFYFFPSFPSLRVVSLCFSR